MPLKIWLITSIRVEPGRPLRASSIQNLHTAAALADHGARVVVWVRRAPPRAADWFQGQLGRPMPDGMRLLAVAAAGAPGEKRSPFEPPWRGRWNRARAWLRGGGAPDAVITRSPAILAQMRLGRLVADRARLVLEWQYPESMQLWRDWRRRQQEAPPMSRAADRLRRLRRLELDRLRHADGILYAARAHERLLERAGAGAPARLLASGCRPPDPAPDPDAEPEFDFGVVGQIAPGQGIETILEALAGMAGARLGLLGPGRESALVFLRDEARRLGVAGRVEFAGAVEPARVRPWMARCRIGLAPVSRRQGPEKCRFASPLRLVEWQAAGVPVIGADVPSISGLVAHGREAWLAAPDRPEAWREAMGRLLGDAGLRRSMAEAGLARAARHGYDRRAAGILEFIRSL